MGVWVHVPCHVGGWVGRFGFEVFGLRFFVRFVRLSLPFRPLAGLSHGVSEELAGVWAPDGGESVHLLMPLVRLPGPS